MANNSLAYLENRANEHVADLISVYLQRKSTVPRWAGHHVWWAIASDHKKDLFWEGDYMLGAIFNFRAFLTKLQHVHNSEPYTMNMLLHDLKRHRPDDFFQQDWPNGFLAQYGVYPPVSAKPVVAAPLAAATDMEAEKEKVSRLLPKAKYPLILLEPKYKQGEGLTHRILSDEEREEMTMALFRMKSMAPGCGGQCFWHRVGYTLLKAAFIEADYLDRGGQFMFIPFIQKLSERKIKLSDVFSMIKANCTASMTELFTRALNMELIPRDGYVSEEEEEEEEPEKMAVEVAAAVIVPYQMDVVPIEYYGHMSTWDAPTVANDDVPDYLLCVSCQANYVGAWSMQCPHSMCRDCAIAHSGKYRSKGEDVPCPKCQTLIRRWNRKH